MSNEERVHPRLRLNVTADVIGGEVVLAHPLADISLGGCRFASTAWEPEGRELQLVLGFPQSGASVPVAGLVVRATERDMGVRFHEISSEQKWALRKQIREAQAH
ncbi:PilZ domain-containing protein [Enhygromyxa salina]|uniref:PilZ domain-containing protein n=1 Tax=Enhygromyxa salina TaxID=215803 RepID=UPI0015E5AE6F|nr:PilZ domain-containing protein [Enhygromyxa salina]